MTSWLQVPRQRPSDTTPKIRPYFFSLENNEFCTHFTSFFYGYMYAKSNNRDLVVYDKSGPISPNYATIEETFAPLDGLSFASEMRPAVTILRPRNDVRVSQFLSSMTVKEFRAEARKVLTWNPKMLAAINTVIDNNDLRDIDSHHVGVHLLQPARGRTSPVENYMDAVKAISAKLKKESLQVFVMGDLQLIGEFVALSPKTWRVSRVNPTSQILRGSSVATFNRQSVANRTTAYIEYLTELYCMQNCAELVCNLGNDTDRFLYLTAKSETVKSIDSVKWVPL